MHEPYPKYFSYAAVLRAIEALHPDSDADPDAWEDAAHYLRSWPEALEVIDSSLARSLQSYRDEDQ